jgi:hypothetical protein
MSKSPCRNPIRLLRRRTAGVAATSLLAVWVGLLAAGCKSSGSLPADGGVSYPALAVRSVNVRVNVAEQLRAAIEMQLSGEPLATIMGRSVDHYIRFSPVPDQYTLQTASRSSFVTDPTGYSLAVESYEYSKMAMNHLAFESGAGLSLMYGPRLNPGGQGGAAALALLRDRVQALGLASRAGSTGSISPWLVVPAPTDNPLNRLGFPGLWPQFAEFRSYDPTIDASRDAQSQCTTAGRSGSGGGGGYGGSGQFIVSDYECSDNSLHLVDRDAQVEKVLAVDGLGLAVWKQALWAINYFQLLHDLNGSQWSTVAESDLGAVGRPGNLVQASSGDPSQSGIPGTYLGASDLEGFQGLLLTEAIDNKAELLLKQLMTSDGKSLGGFASVAAALGYDYLSPLRYFPHAVAVSERPGSAGAESQPTTFSLVEGRSQLADLTALLGGYAEVFALTDRQNAEVGGAQAVRAVFDGDPFAADNGLPDGEPTLHDRALAVLKLALVNLDRLHVEPRRGALVDWAQLDAGQLRRSAHVTTVETVYALVALRTAYRSLSGQLSLYSTATADRISLSSALDGTSMAGAPAAAGVLGRLSALAQAQAALLANQLVGSDGLAVNGYDLAADQADPTPTTLESQAAAIRGLLEAYLITSRADYRLRAERAYALLEQRFYQPTLRLYRPALGEEQTFSFTPSRFAILQSALRQVYILVAARPGGDALRSELEVRLGRLNKRVRNGWDDRNGDGKVDYPGECLRVQDGLPRGGLQLAERALTSELGWLAGYLVGDYDRDCVPNLSYVNLPPILAAELRLAPGP